MQGDVCVCWPLHLQANCLMHSLFARSAVGFFQGAPSIHTSRVINVACPWSLIQEGMQNMRLEAGCSACQKPLAADCAAANFSHVSARKFPSSTFCCCVVFKSVKPKGLALSRIACVRKRLTAIEKLLHGGPMCSRAIRPSSRRPITTAWKWGFNISYAMLLAMSKGGAVGQSAWAKAAVSTAAPLYISQKARPGNCLTVSVRVCHSGAWPTLRDKDDDMLVSVCLVCPVAV